MILGVLVLLLLLLLLPPPPPPIPLLLQLTANEFSLCGSSPYTSTDKINNIHKRNNTKTQKTQVHILPKRTHTQQNPHITKPVKTTTAQNTNHMK